MFRSLACTSASIPLSKSSASSIYASSYGKKIGKNLTDKELNLKIRYLRRYEVSCLKDGSEGQGWAEFGIGVANFLGVFTGTQIDYPDHWFLIAETDDPGVDKFFNLLTSGAEFLLSCLDKSEAGEQKKKEKIKKVEELLKEDNIIKKKIYYLIEKGENGKTVCYFENIDDIINLEKNNYHNNEVRYMESYKLEKDITIKDIIDYVETLSDEYNLVVDNCQVFVRNILNHFC